MYAKHWSDFKFKQMVHLSLSLVQLSPEDVPPIYLKIADLGISRIMSPGGTMGFKGSPGFMAPEILKYVGMEAVTEKVIINSVLLKKKEKEKVFTNFFGERVSAWFLDFLAIATCGVREFYDDS